MHAPPSERCRDAMVQRMSEALVEVRRTWGCPRQIDRPGILRSIQPDVPSLAFVRQLVIYFKSIALRAAAPVWASSGAIMNPD